MSNCRHPPSCTLPRRRLFRHRTGSSSWREVFRQPTWNLTRASFDPSRKVHTRTPSGPESRRNVNQILHGKLQCPPAGFGCCCMLDELQHRVLPTLIKCSAQPLTRCGIAARSPPKSFLASRAEFVTPCKKKKEVVAFHGETSGLIAMFAPLRHRTTTHCSTAVRDSHG